jgi:hypothetical protein
MHEEIKRVLIDYAWDFAEPDVKSLEMELQHISSRLSLLDI